MTLLSALATAVAMVTANSTFVAQESFASAPGWEVSKHGIFCEVQLGGNDRNYLTIRRFKDTTLIEAETYLIYETFDGPRRQALHSTGAAGETSLNLAIDGEAPIAIRGDLKSRSSSIGMFGGPPSMEVEINTNPAAVDILMQADSLTVSPTGDNEDLAYTFDLSDFENAGQRLLQCVASID